jgi:tetratricopeptide (TPR) repeat protein
MMRRMRPPRCLALVVCCVIAVACGSDPDRRTDDWEDHFDRVNQATASGRHDDAMAIADGFLNDHPDNADALLMVGSAYADAAKAASDASRPARFERAAAHYAKALELTTNPMRRLLALVGLIDAYGTSGLNRPEEAERHARLLVADDPTQVNSYSHLIQILKEARRFEALTAAVDEARRAMADDAENVERYGGMVHDLVLFTPDFPKDVGRTMVAEAVARNEQAVASHGRTEDLLRMKGMLLRAQAQLEPDPARQQTLEAASRAAFDELDKLEKE